MTFEEQQAQYRGRCEQALRQVIADCFQEGSKVSEAAEYALLNGGKRVRGVLVLAACDALQGDMAVAEHYAAAIEMIHAFSLVHDDLPCMDDDDLRRGKPATHIAFGEATALLAGDLLSLQAFEAIAAAPAEPQWAMRAVRMLAAAAGARGMIYGQELDLHYEGKQLDGDTLQTIHRHKTGALIYAAVVLGVLAARQDVSQNPALVQYAETIGLVFQMVDDLLDVVSNEEELGKPIGSDAQQGKSTFVTLFGVEQARAEAQRLTAGAVEALRTQYGENAAFLCQYAETLAARAS